MARTIAPHDPKPTSDTTFFDKVYHWTWRAGGFDHKGKKSKNPAHNRLVLHKGPANKCRRVHYWQDGDKG